MEIIIKTQVSEDYETVFQGFTRELFLALCPPFFKMDLIRFDGCEKGDMIKVNNYVLGVFPQKWENEIISSSKNESEIKFIDIGKKIPLGMKSWKHTHIIQRDGDGALIIDQINYKCHFKLIEYIFFPVIYFVFNSREKIYKSYFQGK